MNKNDIIIKLIEAVKKHDCFYNVRSAQYKQFAYKEQLWKNIGKDIGIGSGNETKKKWKNLKDNYRKYKQSRAAGGGIRRQYKYAEALKFLDNFPGSLCRYKTIIPISVDAEVSTDLSSDDEYQQQTKETKPYLENSLDEMQGFSDASSVNNAKTAPANIDTSTTQILSKTEINDENLTTQQKTSDTECPLSPMSSEELVKGNDLHEKLIDEVKKYDCFYNMQSMEYKDYNYKKYLFHKIGKRVGLTANDANRKWRNLKDSYRKYKIRTISENGFVKKYKYADSLRFLDDFYVYRPSKSIVVPEPEVSTDLSSDGDGDMLYVPSSNRKKERFKEMNEISEASSTENCESGMNNPTMTSRLFMVLANKINEADLTSQQKNALEFGVSSYVYSKLAEYNKK
ncbi:uncharacterized protein LOC135951834 [Calliphora vicina]|uniref:uncharacterized protein LOC135951834 n=1 Tax=Calliphora vicina TaxID=7373 RepID=UPI00325AFC7E